MKMNKKGFTLIEMLVVIAIIAVLVSIIIPTVTSATDKAGAAANAANLRAVYAELQTDLLSGGDNAEGYVRITNGTVSLVDAPTSAATKALSINKGTAMTLENNVPVYGGKTIAQFADVAEDGKVGS